MIKKNIKLEFLSFLLILSVMGMLSALYIFDNGFHSIDIAQNMKYLNAEFDLSLVDHTLQGDILTATEAYRLGVWQIRIGFLLFGAGCTLFGITITDMLQVGKS